MFGKEHREICRGRAQSVTPPCAFGSFPKSIAYRVRAWRLVVAHALFDQSLESKFTSLNKQEYYSAAQ